MRNRVCSRHLFVALLYALGLGCGPELRIEQSSESAADMKPSADKDMGIGPINSSDMRPQMSNSIPLGLANCMLEERPQINSNNSSMRPFSVIGFPIKVNAAEKCATSSARRTFAAYEGYLECELTQTTINSIFGFSVFKVEINERSQLHNAISDSGDSMINSRGEIFFTQIPKQRHYTADDNIVSFPLEKTITNDIVISKGELLFSKVHFLFRFVCSTSVNKPTIITEDTIWQVDSLILHPIQ